ncbi:MAG: poly(A) polymerase [Chlamydiales bacterium]|jgi:poly(A) polymerase
MTSQSPEESDSGRRIPEPHLAAGGHPMRRVPADRIDRDALDRSAQRVVQRLQRHGYEAYFVGGCVRDLLIGRVPKDFDVATSADPREIRRLFKNGRIIGRRFRLVHVYYGDQIIETSTFRREPEAQEGSDSDDLLITEDNVFGTAVEDALRRDFTVNALFLDPTEHVILDTVDGLTDLDARTLRTIGDPVVRLAEDPVRIMRAIKFATRLDFRIEPATWTAMCEIAPQLKRAAAPRVLEEILRLLRSGVSLGAFRMLRACGALHVLLPVLDRFLGPRNPDDAETLERAERFWHLLEALDTEVHRGFQPSAPVALAVLFMQVVAAEATRRQEASGDDEQPLDLVGACWDVMEPVCSAARMSRRDYGRARRIISQQPRFTEPQGKRFSPMFFARSEEFPEALDLFRLRVEARGQGWDIYEGWKARMERAGGASDDELLVERKRVKRRRKRRRRGGRRGSSASPPGTDSPERASNDE